ncbi:MAG: glycosyl hydrolase family 17 [Candidatus Cloacimonetes bacterium]|nr:glycosyl hydrolase family 17 [Candidatus Cloacimonadota bacterium]
MNKANTLLYFYIIFLLFSCSLYSGQPKADKNHNPDQIMSSPDSQKTLQKEEPFSIREFLPSQKEKPITKAACYGFYRKGQAPGKKGPTEEELLEDLKIISKNWNLIRIYNSDDYAERILKLIKEKNLPIKLMLGVWLANETDDARTRSVNLKNTLKCIELVKEYPKIICGVNVGNETQVYWSWHKMQAENLIHYIRLIRSNISLPVTTADDYNFWNKKESIKVAEEIDFILVHMHPLWNGKIISNTFEWMNQTYEDIKQIHSDRLIVIGEVGWATDYNPDKNGPAEQGTLVKGEVSLKAQEKFLIELEEWIEKNKVITFLFEIFDESWKGGAKADSRDIEKNWGVFYEDRTPKDSFKKFLLQKDKK